MAIRKLSTATLTSGGKSSKFWDQSTVIPGSYYNIATSKVTTTGVSTITFSSIPSTYTHLQLRSFAATTTPGDPYVQFNGDTGSNYTSTLLYGSRGGSVGDYFLGSANTYMLWLIGNNPSVANAFGSAVLDIFDYKNTNKHKTSRAQFAYDNNGSGQFNIGNGMWMSTSAINSITINGGSNFTVGSHFALYGIK